MKIHLIEITTFRDGTKDSLAIYTHDSYNSAIASYHSKMGSQMKNANCNTETLIIVDADGVYKFEKYVNDAPIDE